MTDLTNLQTVRDRATHIRAGDLILVQWDRSVTRPDDPPHLAASRPQPPKRAWWATVDRVQARKGGKDGKFTYWAITIHATDGPAILTVWGAEAITRQARPEEILESAR